MRLLVTDVTETGRINPLRGRPRGGDRSGLNKLSPLIIGTRFPLQYHREPFKAGPKLCLYPTKHGNGTLVKEEWGGVGRLGDFFWALWLNIAYLLC